MAAACCITRCASCRTRTPPSCSSVIKPGARLVVASRMARSRSRCWASGFPSNARLKRSAASQRTLIGKKLFVGWKECRRHRREFSSRMAKSRLRAPWQTIFANDSAGRLRCRSMVKRSISRDKRNMKPTIAIFIALQFLIGGCARAERPAVRDQNSTLRKETPVVADPDTATQNRITQIAAEAKGSVGVLAIILETNATVASLNPQAHFPMQSVYKLPISMAVIKQVDAGKLRLDQKVPVATEDYIGAAAHSPIRDKYPNGTSLTTEELLRYALSESDGTASDVLMKLAGGHEAVQAHLPPRGLTDMIVLDTENAFTQDHSLQYRNYTTPEAGVSLLRALFERRGLSESGQG